MDKLKIVKIGGHVIENRKALSDFLRDFAALKGPKILVHGGGKEATQMAENLGIEVQIIDGRRVTDDQNLELITMLYAGKLNKFIVAQLQSLNCNSLGLTGADGNSILAVKRPPTPIDFGHVGDLTQVNEELFDLLLHRGITPVCCALSHDGKGQLLNTNADTIAAKLATALANIFEVSLYYCFEKKGVLSNLEDDSSVIPLITKQLYLDLKTQKKLHTGMLPKLENCFTALEGGVKNIFIGDTQSINSTSVSTQIIN